MVDLMDNTTRQARQGSVAAIIQVLNAQLSESGVRTRAIFTDGVLQLLCEASDVEYLEQFTLVERIEQILEDLAPRNINRVNIYCRLVEEQQLLWLEEITRDPDRSLLWLQEIIIRKPNFILLWLRDWRDRPSSSSFAALPKNSSTPYARRDQLQLSRGFLGGLGLSLLVVLLALGVYKVFKSHDSKKSPTIAQSLPSPPAPPTRRTASPSVTSSPSVTPSPSETPSPSVTPSPSETPSPSVTPSPSLTPSPSVKLSSKEAFAKGVELAEAASAEGKKANSREQWLAISEKWDQASKSMDSVSPDFPRYEIARDRAQLYYQYSQDALREADKY
jgi:hypothetical protein